MHDVTTLDLSRIAQDLQIRKTQVESVVQLLDDNNTIPFITRYRKERTGGLNEDVLRQIQGRVTFQRQLAERKQTILKSIEGQGKLTDSLRAAILGADTSKRLEDLYLPYKPKKRSLATAAREKGLEPLALAIWNRDPAARNLIELMPTLINPEKGLNTLEDVQTGVQHILAEMAAETPDVRAVTRLILWESGKICAAKSDKLAEGQGLEYKDYFEFSESLRQIPPHRILALNRGEKENALKIRLDFNVDHIKHAAAKALAEHMLKTTVPPVTGDAAPQAAVADGEPLAPESAYRTPHAVFLRTVLDDALARLVLPSLEREIRRELTEEAESHAVMVFARNLRSLLLQPPLHSRRVLAIDPGFRTGCKVVALDEHGNFLEESVIYPHPTRDREKRAKDKDHAAPPATPTPPVPAPEAGAPPSTPPLVTGETPAPLPATSLPPVPAPEAGTPPSTPPPVAAEAAAPPPAEGPAPVAPVPEAATPPPPVEAASPPTTSVPAPPPAAPPPAPSSVGKREEAKAKICDLVTRLHLNVIAIGNGTACRETEEFVSELIRDKLPELAYVIVNEAGASVYSASAIGREEFPDHDATVRGTISIGRRLQDPLSELVKVDPQSIGVGLYQHDVNPRHLKESLEGIIESCVNQVGVDLNSASVPLLRHVSGLNQMVARDVIEYRKQNGAFKTREQLLQVPNIGPTRYVQAAGFLKLPTGKNPLDRTWIHPESYGVAATLLSELGYGPDALDDRSRAEELRSKLQAVPVEETAARVGVGIPTLRDIIDALARPGRDPRDDLPPPVFKKGILRIEDLQAGMELKGTVLNVVDFGAFVDIGLKDSGLVHISQMANRYIKSPYDVVAVSDVVTVWVLNVDQQRHRVSLTMIKPGTERRPPEKKAPAARAQQPQGTGERPPPPRGGPRPGGTRPQEQRPAGRAGGPPPRRGGRPQGPPQGQPATTTADSAAPKEASPPPRPATVPPRKPRRDPPRPKLSQAALEGKAPLRTFAELGALFAAKQIPPPPPPAPEPPPAPAVVETPPPEEPPAAEEQPAVVEAAAPPQGS
jgi:protein Tex